jgi:hypothetical protein
MKYLILIGLATFGLAACAGPTITGSSDTAQIFPGQSQMAHPTGPYDNTMNSLGGRYVGGGD